MASLIHAVAHGLVADQAIRFGNVLPTDSGIDETLTYYVLASGLTADDFEFSETVGGTAFVLDNAITDGVIRSGDEYGITDSVEMPVMDPLDTPTGLTLSTDVVLDADGHQIVKVKAAFTPGTFPAIISTKIELTSEAGPDWTKAQVLRAPLGTDFVQFVVPGNVTVYVRAASEDVYGRISNYTSVESTTSAKDTTAPATPTGFTITGMILGVVGDWVAQTEADLSHYELQIADNSGFTNPTLYTFKIKSNTIPINPLPPGTWYGRVRAVDTSGNASAYTATQSDDARYVDVGDLDPANIYENATNLLNGPATVTIDDDGITITDGALLLEDEFGKTVLVASGFSGSWNDFVSTGLYNSRFQAGTVGTVANGRTAALPYWTVSDPDTTAMTLELLASGAGVKMSWSQINKRKRIISDPVPVTGRYFEAGFEAIAAGTVANIKHTVTIHWYDAAMSLLGSSVVLSSTSPPFAGVVYFAYENQEILSTGVVYAKLQIEAQEQTTHSASNSLTLRGVWLRSSPSALNNVSADSVSAGTITTTGDVNLGGDVNLTGGINVGSSATPVVNNKGTATFSTITSTWVQIGKLVVARIQITCSANGSGATALTVDTGLPQSSGNFVVWGDRGGTGVNKWLARAVATGGSIQLTGLQLITAIGTNLTGADLANGATYSAHLAYISV